MNWKRANALLLVAAWLSGKAHVAAGQPANWVTELPTVEAVRASTTGGKNADDTKVRQAAAFVVWQDLIEVLTGMSDVDLARNQSAPGAVRFMDYRRASEDHPGHAMVDVWAYSELVDFRKDVLARYLSPASQEAYWKVRSATIAARDARRKAFATSEAHLAEFPTVERVTREMKGVGARDTAGRTEAAFRWLAVFADALASGRSLAGKYNNARDQLLESNPEGCSQEAGCVPQNAGSMSRFYYCRASYESSATFARALFEKYVPKDLKDQIAARLPGAGGEVWGFARLVPVGLPLPDAPSVCTTTGQANGCQMLAESAVQRDKILKDYARRQRGLAIQQRKDELAKRVRPPEILADVVDAHDHRQSLSVYEVGLGSPLAVLVCPDDEASARGIKLLPNGCPDDGLSQGIHFSAKPDVGLEHALGAWMGIPLPPVEQTCAASAAGPLDPTTVDSTILNFLSAGASKGISATSLRVAQVKRPSWLHSFRLPVALERNGFVVAVSAETQGPGVEEAALRDLEREYGPGSRRRTKEMSDHQRDWFLHGLHIVYGESSVLYELESFHKERIKTAGERWPIASAHAPAGAVRTAPLPGQSYEDFLGERRAHQKAERLEQLHQDQIDVEGTGVTTPEQQQEQTRIDQERHELGQ